MSVEVEIVPTAPDLIRWKTLTQELRRPRLTLAAQGIFGSKPLLRRQGTHEIISDDSVLGPGRYYFELNEPNTLGLTVDRNGDLCTDEEEVLMDFARNMDALQKKEIARLWKAAGISYVISSFAGRHRCEAELFVCLCVSVGRLCHGVILVKDPSLFSVPVGCYSPEEFEQTQPLF